MYQRSGGVKKIDENNVLLKLQQQQELVRQGEAAWLLERLRESSNARVTSVKSQQEDLLTYLV